MAEHLNLQYMRKFIRKHGIAVFVMTAAVLSVLSIIGQSRAQSSGLRADPTRQDLVMGRESEVAEELRLIQEDNRLCSVIGAYTIINTTVTKPTRENVEDLVIICDCWYPDIIMAQYQIESASGTSSVAKRNHNLFGMKKAFTRKSVRCRDFDKTGYAVYNNWQLSVIDRIYWEEYVFHGEKPSRNEYLDKIKRTYAEDDKYIHKILAAAEKYSDLLEYSVN